MRTTILPGIFVFLALGSPAAALDATPFYESCFIRNYDADHLAKHPGQQVAAMQVEIIEWEANPFVRINYALRGGANYSLAGDCYDEISGGFLCHLCLDDSCDSGEETFKVLLKSNDSITIVNDTTGITGDDEGGARNHLDPGGEHGAFALSRTNYSVCEN